MRTRAVALLFVTVALWTSGCDQLFTKPTVTVERVDLASVSFSGITANVIFRIENHNSLGLDLAKLLYQLTVDDHTFVQGSSSTGLHVPARGIGQLTLPLSFTFSELAQSMQTLFTKRQLTYTVQTQIGFGTPLGVLTVPVTTSGTLPVPQLPTLSLGPANVSSLSIAGATLSVPLLVHNVNPFPLPLGSFKYALSLEGVPLLSASTPPTTVGSGATLPLQLAAHIDFIRAGTGILRAIEARSATVSLDGSFDLLGYTMPVHLSRTLR